MKKKLFKKLNIHNYFITYIIMSSQKKSFEKLRKFLAKFRVKSGQKHSNTSMGNLKGSFYIPDDKYEKFLDVYEEAILNGNTFIHQDSSKVELVLHQVFSFHEWIGEVTRILFCPFRPMIIQYILQIQSV